MDEKKSAAYKNLVAEVQKKYPAYGSNFKSKLPGTASIATPETKQIAKAFFDKLGNLESFISVLEKWGLDCIKTSNDQTTQMWALNALANAIADGFDLDKAVAMNLDSPVQLWSAVVDKQNICREINLSTYWQGFGYADKTPKIKYLLVDQDYGSFFDDPDLIENVTKMNETGQWIAPDESNAQGTGTDANLHKLFAVLDRDLFKLNDDVFFTNFCLGYCHGKNSGGITKTMLARDRDEFKKLCDILEPENILCLGRNTFKRVFRSLTGFNINNMSEYNNFLDNNTCFPATCGRITTRVFPLAHCGSIGTGKRSFEKQIEDWRRIAKITSQPSALDDISDDDDSEEIPNETKYKQTALYGAILGDIIGSPFEFRKHRQQSKDFELFSHGSKFTDDTIMTMAVAEAILRTKKDADASNDKENPHKDKRSPNKKVYKNLYESLYKLSKNVERLMHSYGRKYSKAGYGGRFREWLSSDNPKPYGSLGNGSAMRVSAAGWVHDKMFETRECARMTARPTHNHPEGIKGAVAVASAIFLARSGKSKEEIKNYIESEFNYDLSRSLDEIRVAYKIYAEKCTGSVTFDETCPGSVPEAIIAFLVSTDFEDTIRNAVSLGGDTDTQAAIAGSIAEAFYGIPDELIQKCREFLPEEFLEIVDEFNQKYCPDNDPDNDSDDQPKKTKIDKKEEPAGFDFQVDDLNTILSDSSAVNDFVKKQAEMMETAINKFELTEQLVTYCRADISLLPKFKAMMESDGIFIDEGFTSTTVLPIGSTENEIEICFLIPKAIGIGAYIALMSEVPDECEFVLNCGTFFKVHKIVEDESGHVQVVVAVLGRFAKELN